MGKPTKEHVMQSLERFVREFGKMPSKKDMKEVDYLLSYSTIVRVVGNIRDLGLVEKVTMRIQSCANSVVKR